MVTSTKSTLVLTDDQANLDSLFEENTDAEAPVSSFRFGSGASYLCLG